MWFIPKWLDNPPNTQEKQSRDAKLYELGTPEVPYAERQVGEPQYCGEAAVEYVVGLGAFESNVLSVSSPFMALTPIQKRDGRGNCLMGLGTHG